MAFALDRRIVRTVFEALKNTLRMSWPVCLWLALAPAQPQSPTPAPAPTTPVRAWTNDLKVPAQLGELSGLAVSRRFPGAIWGLNDSGNEPRLFAIERQGKLLGDYLVENAENHDWESLALDEGALYVSDLGNNNNNREDLAIYLVPEPDPEGDGPVLATERIPVVYPEQRDAPEFDCEAVFVSEHKLYVLTKERVFFLGRRLPGTATRLYRLDTRFPDRPNRLTLIERRTGLGGWVTGADMSPDGKTLAILCHMPVPSVWLFERPARGDKLLSGPARRLILSNAGQAEALAWESQDVILVGNEGGNICRVNRSEFGPVGTGR